MSRFYLHVAATAFRRQLVYRWANLAGMATNIFFGAVVSYLYIALFQARPHVAGFDVRATLRYIWLVQALIMVCLPFGWLDLALTIRSGQVVADLAKPCDLFWYWFAREAGRSAYYLLFRAIPTYAAGALLFGLGVPTGAGAWGIFGAMLVLGAASGIAYRYLGNLATFWVLEGRAVVTMFQVVALFFTGSYIPIMFFPGTLRAFAEWSPFFGMESGPVQAFLGALAGPELALTLARQAFWLVALVLLARGITAIAARRVVIQGG